MFERINRPSLFILCLLCLMLVLLATAPAESSEVTDEKIIERYKLMLERKPKEGSTFDRLYHFYVDGAGLERMVADYQAEIEAKPNNASLQLILGHIFKRLDKNTEAVSAYKRAIELTPNDYYPHFALGQVYATLRRHQDAIAVLKQAAELSSESNAASLDELIALYKALGRAYFSRDHVEEAILAWGKIAEIDPQNIFARIQLADLFREQELYTKAIEQHEVIIRLKKDDPYRVCLSHREIGKIHEEKGDYQKAIQSYDAAITLTTPGNWLRKDVQRRIIGVFASDGNWQGLVAYYQRKLQTARNDPELIGLLASAYIENQQRDEGIDAYRKALELAPADTALRLELITVLRNAEKFDEAAAEYEFLSGSQPDDLGIYRELGELYLELQDENRAKTTFRRVIDRDPGNAGIHLTLADIYASHEWKDDAVAAYEKAASLAPNNLDYIQYYGEYYLRQGKRDKAVEIWNRMVVGDKAIPENYDRLARLLWTKEFRIDAIAASRNAVALAPGEYRYREALARRLTENKEYDAALSEYAEASKLAPNEFFAERMYDQQIEFFRRQGVLAKQTEKLAAAPKSFDREKQLAKMYLMLGNKTNAMESLIQAKTLKPDDVSVNRRLAALYAKQGLGEEAVAIYEHLAKIDSGNAREYFSDIARLQLKERNFNPAIQSAKQVIALSPRNPESYQLLANIERKHKNYAGAINSLKQAVRLRADAIDIRVELAEVYRLAGENRLAINQYWRCWDLIEDLDDKLSLVDELTKVYDNLGTDGALEEKLRKLNQARPTDLAPAIALAELYRKRAELSAAISLLEKTLEHNREDPNVLSQLAEINHEIGNSEEAIGHQQRLVKLQPNSAHQQRLAELLFETGREREAIQAWRRLLHARNQTAEAEIQLASLFIRYNLQEEARLALTRAAERAKSAERRYHIGALLEQLNEVEAATRHFERILTMPTPYESSVKKSIYPTSRTTRLSIVSSLPDTSRFDLPKYVVRRITDRQRASTSKPWLPSSFAEIQAGALAQLFLIAKKQRQINEFANRFESYCDSNPSNLEALENLAAFQVLAGNSGETAKAINRLITLSPDDKVYHAARIKHALPPDLDYETAKGYLDELDRLSLEARLWYTCRLLTALRYQGRRDDAKKLMFETEFMNVDYVSRITDTFVMSNFTSLLVQLGAMDAAETLLSRLVTPPSNTAISPKFRQHLSNYQDSYGQLADVYARNGQKEKAVALLWKSFTHTRPVAAKMGMLSSGHANSQLVPSDFPVNSIYYGYNWAPLLRKLFFYYWSQDRLDSLYAKLDSEFRRAEGEDKIYYGLALTCFYWWDGALDTSLEILAMLEAEFPDSLTILRQATAVFILTGRHNEALRTLDRLVDKDPKNRMRYYDFMLQISAFTGNTIKVRELLSRILKVQVNVEALLKIIHELEQNGLRQFAIQVANKAVKRAAGQSDPKHLKQLSQLLERLGRANDSAIIAERARHLSHRMDSRQNRKHNSAFQRTRDTLSRGRAPDQEAKLLAAIKKSPDSIQARMRLATYYERVNDSEKAARAFQAALSVRPEDGQTRLRYAQILMQLQQYDSAVAQYLRLFKDNLNVISAPHWETVRAFFEAGKVDEIVLIANATIPDPKNNGSSAVTRRRRPYFYELVADECTRRKLHKRAAEIYEKVLEATPNASFFYDKLASAYIAAKEHRKAIRFLQGRLEAENSVLSEDQSKRVMIVQRLIEIQMETGTLQTLARKYENQLTQEPNDLELLYVVALIRLTDGDVEGAEPLITRLLEDGSATNLRWFLKLADVYRAAGAREKEAHLLEQSIQKFSPHPVALNPHHLVKFAYDRLASAYAEVGDSERAKMAIRKRTTISIIMHGHGEDKDDGPLYIRHKMWDDAERVYTGILNDPTTSHRYREEAPKRLKEIQTRKNESKTEVQPEEKMNPSVLRVLARSYREQNQTAKAMHLYEQLARIMPEDYQSRSQLAEIYSIQGMHHAAIMKWHALTDADPQNTAFQAGLLDAYQSAGKIAEAIQVAKKYIEKGKYTVHNLRLARLYAAVQREDEAISTYRNTIEVNPDNISAYQELAQLCVNKGDLDDAECIYYEALEYARAKELRQEIEGEIIDLYRRQGKLGEKLEAAEAKGKLTFRLQWELAQYYRDQCKWEKAAEAYTKALDMTTDPSYKERIPYALVTAYAQLGQHQLALDLFQTLSRSASFGQMAITASESGPFNYMTRVREDDARRRFINAYRNAMKLDDLIAYLKNLPETEVDNPTLLEISAEIHRSREDYARAAEKYGRLGEVQPKNVRSFYYAAAALNKSNQYKLAQEMLNEGEDARTSNGQRNQDTWRLIELGNICLDGELFDSATQLIRAAIANDRESGRKPEPMLTHMLAKAHFGAKRYMDAVEAYRRLADTATDNRMRKIAIEGLRKARREGNLLDQSIGEETQIAQ